MKTIKTYHDLEVYQRAYRLALEIHKVTITFPSIEKYEIGSQIRRASKSAPTNIAEGFGRKNFAKEYVRFLGIAKASIDEMQVHLEFCYDLGYLIKERYQYFRSEYEIVGKQLSALINVWLKFKKPNNLTSP